jgi:hypothetical protein
MAAAARDINSAPSVRKRGRPATTPEDREKQLQNKAYDLAERQLDAGTASSQVITMLIKGGGVREQLELERLQNENRLLNARIEQLQSAVRLEGLMEEALLAFRSYTGESPEEFDD